MNTLEIESSIDIGYEENTSVNIGNEAVPRVLQVGIHTFNSTVERNPLSSSIKNFGNSSPKLSEAVKSSPKRPLKRSATYIAGVTPPSKSSTVLNL